MEKYRILDHIADFKIKAFGKTKSELFRNAMLAMEFGLRPKFKVKKAENKIRIESKDLEDLLFDFLGEINYLNEVNREVYQSICFDKFSDTAIEADVFGKKVSRFGLQIKGVTLHEFKIRQRKDGIWEAVVLFDI